MPSSMSTSPLVADEFLSGAQEIIDALSKDLMELGQLTKNESEPELVKRIFRGAHSLKGLAALYEVASVAQLAHAVEDLLDEIRVGRIPFSGENLDLLLEAVELFQRMVFVAGSEGLGEHPEIAALSFDLVSSIQDRRQSAMERADSEIDWLGALGLDSERNVLTEYEEHRIRENANKGNQFCYVNVTYLLEEFESKLAAVNEKLKKVGEVIATLPSEEIPTEKEKIAFKLLFATAISVSQLEEVLLGVPAKIRLLSIAACRATKITTNNFLTQKRLSNTNVSLRNVSKTLRVDIEKLDQVMNIVGELVLAKTRLVGVAEKTYLNQKGGCELEAVFQADIRFFERKFEALQRNLLEIRMVPLEQIFSKLGAIVRRAAKEVGKEINFCCSGGDVKLDKQIVEDLADPLMHIVRNAIDHGIELQDARLEAGKSPRGTISLFAEQRGSQVVIEVQDDGRGIDEEAVRGIAVERGLASAHNSEVLSQAEMVELLFTHSFSTARQVSELSGRGVGLDVVKTNIAKHCGIVELKSTSGKGTVFSIKVPVTMAIVRSIVVGVSGRIYVLPLNSVTEIVSVSCCEVLCSECGEFIKLRDHKLPLVRLAALFRLSDSLPAGVSPGKPTLLNSAPVYSMQKDGLFVVVIGFAKKRLGLVVDELWGQQDVVVKPLGGVVGCVKGFSGATDLGQGNTVLVLDVKTIVEEVL